MIDYDPDDSHLPFLHRRKVCTKCEEDRYLYEYGTSSANKCQICVRKTIKMNKQKIYPKIPCDPGYVLRWKMKIGTKM